MIERKKILPVLPLLFLIGVPIAAHSQAAGDDTDKSGRGELLYSTYCGACHEKNIHWRARTLVTDWHSLLAQVSRWQQNSGLSWDEGDTEAIALYLNASVYHLSPGDSRR